MNDHTSGDWKRQPRSASSPLGSCPPGTGTGTLGVGEWVNFVSRADSNGERAIGLLKGVVWPAFLVYEAFSAVAGRPEQG